MRAQAFVLAFCLLPPGCARRPLAQDDSGRFLLLDRLIATDPGAANRQVAAAITAGRQFDTVLADDDRLAAAAAAACSAAGYDRVQIVSAGMPAPIARQLVAGGDRAAAIAVATGEAAVDLALLACSGVSLPLRMPLGAVLFTAANAAAGGAAVPAPGDFALALLRREAGAILSTTPATDVVFRFGLLGGDEQQRAAVATAAGRYPQVELQAEHSAEQLISANVNALLVAIDRGDDHRGARITARAAAIPVIAIGHLPDDEHFTCWVGSDAAALGRAAALAIQTVQPAGARMLELVAEDGPTTREWRRALAAALGWRDR